MTQSFTNLTFDPSIYNRPLMFSLASGIALGQALLVNVPTGGTVAIKKSANRLRKSVQTAQEAWGERQRQNNTPSGPDPRIVDQEGDSSWRALEMRLQACALLPSYPGSKSRRAAAILQLLFGSGGLSFLCETYSVQWATMDTLLKRIDMEGLAHEIDIICGREYLDQIRSIHPRYQKMVQEMFQRESGGSDLREPLRDLGRCIVDYATKVVALADPDDAESTELVERALRPILTHRETMSERRAASSATPDAPASAEASPLSESRPDLHPISGRPDGAPASIPPQ